MRKTTIILLLVSVVFAKAEAQKGEKSLAAGLLISFPENRNIIYMDNRSLNTGVGLEGIGQYNFTQKSAALLQLQLTRFSGQVYYNQFSSSFIGLSLKGGYRYQFTTSGFYANVLVGVETGSDGSLNTAAVLGLGKRFAIKDVNFIDAGLDYIIGDISRFNIKAVFSLLRRPKDN
jgi:hypothetical protein